MVGRDCQTDQNSWWWNEETEKAVKEKKDRLKTWKRTSAESDRKEYKLAKSTAKKVVARVKAEAIDGLYDHMETREGQKDVYRIAAARDRAGTAIGQIRTIKSAIGELLIYLIIRRCARTGAFPGAFCVPNSVALASLTLQVVNWAIH